MTETTRPLRVLVACEYSGTVRDAFIAAGHRAVSCDILPTERPGPHYQGDVRDILDLGWDMMVAHPSCTYLTCAAEWAYKDDPGKKMKPGTLFGANRRQAREEALEFIELLWKADIPLIAIENPVGVINTRLPFMPKPQFIQPYDFGEDASKRTGLWLKGLPRLSGTQYVEPRIVDGKPRWANQTDSGQNRLAPSADRGKIRSLTYQGIGNAIAEQWGGVELSESVFNPELEEFIEKLTQGETAVSEEENNEPAWMPLWIRHPDEVGTGDYMTVQPFEHDKVRIFKDDRGVRLTFNSDGFVKIEDLPVLIECLTEVIDAEYRTLESRILGCLRSIAESHGIGELIMLTDLAEDIGVSIDDLGAKDEPDSPIGKLEGQGLIEVIGDRAYAKGGKVTWA